MNQPWIDTGHLLIDNALGKEALGEAETLLGHTRQALEQTIGAEQELCTLSLAKMIAQMSAITHDLQQGSIVGQFDNTD